MNVLYYSRLIRDTVMDSSLVGLRRPTLPPFLIMAEEDKAEFSVFIFFPDGSYVDEQCWITAEAAAKLVVGVTNRPAAKIGMIKRIIITDGGDFTVWEWKYGEGVTFPPPKTN